MDMPKPTDQHRKLERLVGHWEGAERMAPSQWVAEGGTATGRNHIRSALDGFAVVTDYEQERDGKITFRGHGVTTYDAANERYVMHWLDVMSGPMMEVFTGGFDGDVMVLTQDQPPMRARVTWDLSDDGVMHSHMEMSEDGVDWATLFEADYERA